MKASFSTAGGLSLNFPCLLREGVSAHVMRGFIADTTDASEAGVFDDPDGKLCWIPLVLAEAGAGALSELVAEFVDGVLALQGSATGRQVADGDDASASRTATVFLASFPSTRDRREGVRASAAKLR